MKKSNEQLWSPFDPEWYKEAFDKFTSTADQLFYQDEILKQGYSLPDGDGSKSSAFRKAAVLNNSFNEKLLRETLKDIYLNSTNVLSASNHGSVQFFQYATNMESVKIVPNTNYCELSIPTESFIDLKDRDKIKRKGFIGRWVSDTEILNNWDVFKFHCMLFINQRVYSEYELRFEPQEIKIRFKYENFWIKKNYPIYIYKFDTKYQYRVKISREMIMNQLDYKYPITKITDDRINNFDHCIIHFNRIDDQSVRFDNKSHVDIMGHNLEFVNINDGVIDLTQISDMNKSVIYSELREWTYMTVIVPKYIHEYPILLPADIVYRPYRGKYIPIWTMNNAEYTNVNYEKSQVYINMDENIEEWNDGWKTMIRPLVLSDAFEDYDNDPYIHIKAQLDELKNVVIETADFIEDFRLNIDDVYIPDYVETMISKVTIIRDLYNNFLTNHQIDLDNEFDKIIENYNEFIDEIIKEEYTIIPDGIWNVLSSILNKCYDLMDVYKISIMVDHMGSKQLWSYDDVYKGTNRFSHPIEKNDFWTFEYDFENNVWYPYIMQIEHYFPDVYVFNDGENEIKNRVFKSFFFYSDSINNRNVGSAISKPTPSWDKDMETYMYNQGGVYRDIFMEKFYWSGIKTIYDSLVVTKYKWEILEYIKDNTAYTRFNDLFLKTMDPYFKMGLSTYLQHPDYGFPLDYAVSKLNESITQKFLSYEKITNYEMYLNKTWVPSYFDYIVKIMNNWEAGKHLVRRPRNSFNIFKVARILSIISEKIHPVSDSYLEELNSLRDDAVNKYSLNSEILDRLISDLENVNENIDGCIKFTSNLDLDIYSLEDIKELSLLIQSTMLSANEAINSMKFVNENVSDNNYGNIKISKFNTVYDEIHDLRDYIDIIVNIYTNFDIESFMKKVNDPAYLDDVVKRDNLSIIGIMNIFTTNAWSDEIQIVRNRLYISTVALWTYYDTHKVYSSEELSAFANYITDVKLQLTELRRLVFDFWTKPGTSINHLLEERLNESINEIYSLEEMINDFITYRILIIDKLEELKLDMLSIDHLTPDEVVLIESIDENFNDLITTMSSINNGESILSTYEFVLSLFDKWKSYIDKEIELFIRLSHITEEPNEFIEVIDEVKRPAEQLSEYLVSINVQYIPETQWPSYMEIYEVSGIEIIDAGFNYKKGDICLSSVCGVSIVDEINDDNEIISLDGNKYRKTTFKDPSLVDEYDTISDNYGLGLKVKPRSIEKRLIINDTPLARYVENIKSICYLINRDIDIINPSNNSFVENTIVKIDNLSDEWSKLIELYQDYISIESLTIISSLINADLVDVRACLVSFIESRSRLDVEGFLLNLNNFIVDSYNTFKSNGMITPNYVYFDNRLRTVYYDLLSFYNNGNSWNDREMLISNIENVIYELNLFYRKLIKEEYTKLIEEYNSLITMHDILVEALNELPMLSENIQGKINTVLNIIINLPELKTDEWYKINNINISYGGSGYKVGDIVKIIPELPVDGFNNEIHENEEIIMNDTILCKVILVDENGSVKKMEPYIEYAIPYMIQGSRKTETIIGEGKDLRINVFSINPCPSYYQLEDNDDYVDKLNLYDENDLLAFEFENTNNIPIQYELFYAGKQINDFIVKHEFSNGAPGSYDVDVIYIHANDIMQMINSSIKIKGENYFNYKIDNVEIVDSGSGYSVGQEIVLNANGIPVKLKVTELNDDPYGGIKSVEFMKGNVVFNKVDPSGENLSVVNDSLNNIDDEFNDGYYDSIPGSGIDKPATKTYGDTYLFRSRRFDNLEDGSRNKTFMYPDVSFNPDAPEGDPEYQIYLGDRYDEDIRWNGINDTIPPTDGIIPDENRVPDLNNMKGEYQLIDTEKIHKQFEGELGSIDSEDISSIIENAEESENRTFYNHNVAISPISDERLQDIVEGDPDPEAKHEPTVKLHGAEVRAIDVSRIRQLIYGEVEAMENPSAYIDECFVVKDVKLEGETITDSAFNGYNLSVETHASLPMHINEWEDVNVGYICIVEQDETCNNHRTAYRVNSFTNTGYIDYDEPDICDLEWNSFNIDWMNIDFYPDLPSLNAQYPSDEWWTKPSFRIVQHDIKNGSIKRVIEEPTFKHTSYIDNLTVDDLSVYNFTSQEWEDLHDETRWRLTIKNDPSKNEYGFILEFIADEYYECEMRLYLNKVPSVQMKNACAKRNAIFNIDSFILDEVDIQRRNILINLRRDLRIRKMFPFKQVESYIVDNDHREMNFILDPSTSFRNEIHLEDVTLFNKTLDRFEDLTNKEIFDIQYKDPVTWSQNNLSETNTTIKRSMISNPGYGFTNGFVWGWNDEYRIHLFGKVITDFMNDGSIISFIPIHYVNAPKANISLSFDIFQYDKQKEKSKARVVIEFETKTDVVHTDGYLHDIDNPLAPIAKELKIIDKRDLPQEMEYDIIIDKQPKEWKFVREHMEIYPIFELEGIRIPEDRIYITTDMGRIPLINPATNKPSIYVSYTDTSTKVLFLNIYHEHERMVIHSSTYPMRSVYTRRSIPSNGYIDLAGKINKPLNKKYFEFWLNGKLLDEEVTIISPTKLFIHGATSLRNLEIIEINRDPNEYFSDIFINDNFDNNRPTWNFTTYLDDALSGDLIGDNYTTEEQLALLYPVWTQVDLDDEEYKNYPENVDTETDILIRIDDATYIQETTGTPYQFSVVGFPLIESIPMLGSSISFEDFNFIPISEEEIIDMLNDEWKEEILNGDISSHLIISEDEWIGMILRLYDAEGNEVFDLSEAVYKIIDPVVVRINNTDKTAYIIKK